jgi:hypothetical protein
MIIGPIAGDACIKIINFGDPFTGHSRIAEGLPAVRKRRAKSLSGSYSISVLTVP